MAFAYDRKRRLCDAPEYTTWRAMKRRCSDPNHWNFKWYGGKGVFVCEQWLDDPWAFIEWMRANGWEKGLSVDRIDDDGPYSPENCRIVDQVTQQRSKSISRRATVNGKTKTLAEWSEKTGINYYTLKGRLNAGWSGERLISPVQA